MPDTVKEETYQGKPVISVLAGIGRDGKEYWFSFGVSKAEAKNPARLTGLRVL